MNRLEHLLTCLSEECAEVAKDASKALRFTLDDKLTLDPHGPRGTVGPTNAQKIAAEFIDLLAVYAMLVQEGALPSVGISITDPETIEAIERKRVRVEDFMGYAMRVGALELPNLGDFETAVPGVKFPGFTGPALTLSTNSLTLASMARAIDQIGGPDIYGFGPTVDPLSLDNPFFQKAADRLNDQRHVRELDILARAAEDTLADLANDNKFP